MIGKNIRFLRIKHEMSQDVLAEKLGYSSYTTIQKWESGVSEPPLKIVVRLAQLWNVDIDNLAKEDLEQIESTAASRKQELDCLSQLDRDIIQAFHGADAGTQNSVCKLLDIDLAEGKYLSA